MRSKGSRVADGALRAANPNDLGTRAAMGLPDAVVRRTAIGLLADDRDLLGFTPADLARIVESPDVHQGRRLAAGALLALLGDPRIEPLAPQMVFVPAQAARLGSPAEEVEAVTAQWAHVGVVREWILKEFPAHTREIAAFRIARYPVTNCEFLMYLEDTAADELPSSWRFGAYPAHLSNHPVWTVSPQQADAYAAWLSARTGRRFRLPSEAEWELAAAGPERRAYPWGDTFDPGLANTVEEGPLQTTPVGCYPRGASPFGLLDMAGNVEEFVSGDYTAYPGGPSVTDDLARSGAYRVARGGSFTRFGDLARTRRRHGWFDRDLYAIGFRLAEDC
jgi:formylglycine-generating enzyme required for sulfatase activity